MSERQYHTPGPWSYHLTEINPYHAYIHGNDKECIAIMDSRGGLAKTEEIKANARLIAAAPELMEACQSFLDMWNRAGPMGSHQFEKFDCVVRKCSIAVDKATSKVV